MSGLTTQVMFFPEGPGYILQSVLADNASQIWIVVSCADGQRYIRKMRGPIFPESESIKDLDARKTRPLPSNDSLAKPVGWAEYEETNGDQAYTVVYYPLYNSGTLQGLLNNLEAQGESAPEAWIWECFDRMLTALSTILSAGVSHGDEHLDNWFLHVPNRATASNQGFFPQIVLGDWNEATIRNASMTEEEWMKWAFADWQQVQLCLEDLISDKLQNYSQALRVHWQRFQSMDPLQSSSMHNWLASLRAFQNLMRERRLSVPSAALTSHIPLAATAALDDLPRLEQRYPRFMLFEDAVGLISGLDFQPRWFEGRYDDSKQKLTAVCPPSNDLRTTFKYVTNQEHLPSTFKAAQDAMTVKFGIDMQEEPEVDYEIHT